ncbi:hypothetical protein FHY11_000883 [Xanthomonas arboricola]|uniref:hypothetical protein n=1 Tax=Xanthomonas euroxanthea TaxID=2259622 RepID=UPI00141B276E|nr:hypothetical protein [Xanthomonas euroxanthea]NIK07417.1 hypothetical protein [Xanthomonas euroxanthea]
MNAQRQITYRYTRARVTCQPEELRDRQLIVRLVTESFESNGTPLHKAVKAKLRGYAAGKIDLVET